MTLEDLLKKMEESNAEEFAMYLEEYLSAGGDINAISEDGNSLMHQAFFYEDIEMVDVLVSKGADIDVVAGDKANTPFLECVLLGRYDYDFLNAVFCGYELDFHRKNKDRLSALMVATERMDSRLVDMIIEESSRNKTSAMFDDVREALKIIEREGIKGPTTQVVLPQEGIAILLRLRETLASPRVEAAARYRNELLKPELKEEKKPQPENLDKLKIIKLRKFFSLIEDIKSLSESDNVTEEALILMNHIDESPLLPDLAKERLKRRLDQKMYEIYTSEFAAMKSETSEPDVRDVGVSTFKKFKPEEKEKE